MVEKLLIGLLVGCYSGYNEILWNVQMNKMRMLKGKQRNILIVSLSSFGQSIKQCYLYHPSTCNKRNSIQKVLRINTCENIYAI